MDELTRSQHWGYTIGTCPYTFDSDWPDEYIFYPEPPANNADDWDNLDIDIYDPEKPF
jgi:hypothetical protein